MKKPKTKLEMQKIKLWLIMKNTEGKDIHTHLAMHGNMMFLESVENAGVLVKDSNNVTARTYFVPWHVIELIEEL